MNLKEIRERCEAATPGPWKMDEEFIYIKGFAGPMIICRVNRPVEIAWNSMGNGRTYSVSAQPNKEFIAHARTDIPLLLDRIDALETENAELIKFRDDMECYLSEKNMLEAQTDEAYEEITRLRAELERETARAEGAEAAVEDVMAEGLPVDNEIRNPDPTTHESIINWNLAYAHHLFRDLWDSINSARGFGWDINPWVWVIEFERCEKPKEE